MRAAVYNFLTACLNAKPEHLLLDTHGSFED